MHRIDTSTRLVDANGSGKDGFQDEAAPATPATAFTAAYFNDLQEEICNVITDQGIALVKGTKTQLLSALDQRFAKLALGTLLEKTNPGNFDLYDIAYHEPTYASDISFVAVGQADGTNAYMVASVDGHLWTEQTNPKNFALNSICYGNGLWVAVGGADGTDAYIVTSTDGVTWTERSNPKNFGLQAVTYGGGVFVAVGAADGTDAYIISSADGFTWTERSNARNVTLRAVAHNGTVFVAGGQDDLTDCYLLTSTDGSTWTERATPKRGNIYGIAWGGSLFVAIAQDSTAGIGLFTSPDGTTWTDRTATALTANAITSVYNVAYGAGVFVVQSGNSKGMLISFDGLVWETLYQVTEQFAAAVYGRGVFIMVGNEDNGADAAIFSSLQIH